MTLRKEILVGIDYGRKRIGIAVSTPLGTVHPRPRLERRTEPADLAALEAVFLDTGAQAIVMGLPHNMDGTTSGMEREARAFAKRLAQACGLPVFGCDERLTSVEADAMLRDQELDGRARKRRRDSAAACLLLRDFLAREHDQEERIA